MNGGKKEVRQKVIARHINRLEREIIKLQEIDQRYFWVRLGILIAGILSFFIAYQSRSSSLLLIVGLAFLMTFSLVVYFNRKLSS